MVGDYLLIWLAQDKSALDLSAIVCHISDRQHGSIREVLGMVITGHAMDRHVEERSDR